MSDLVLAALLCALSVLASWVLTGLIRRRAMQSGMLDRPNERSSHNTPTPRGGGLAVLIVTGAGIAVAIAIELLPAAVGLAVLPGYLAIGWIGWRDDRQGVPASIRFVVHLASAAWLLVVIEATLGSGNMIASVHAVAVAGFLWISIAWATNVFNFMDGIDGIAGSQGIFLGAAGVGIAILQGQPGFAVLWAVVAGSCAGFLVWNWPPARIFMGDVGSGSLGFLCAALPVVSGGGRLDAIWPWVILWSTFVVDATVTLIRRAMRREAVHKAHRSHAYQWMSRRWNSHTRVTVCFISINVLWVAPLAYVAALWPARGMVAAMGCLAPLVVLALIAGAGKSETSP